MSENNKLLLLAVEEYKKQNYSVAVPMFAELADKQNDPKAQAFLAYCYFQGLGIEKSFEKAVEYYKKITGGKAVLFENDLPDNY